MEGDRSNDVMPRREVLWRGGLLLGAAAAGPTILSACAASTASGSPASTGGSSATAPPGTQAPSLPRPGTPAQVAETMRAGNQRFMADTPLHPNQGSELRDHTTEKQVPFAAILGCADSRVEPTLIFDQGIGDFFVVRNAGNLADATSAASLAYAVEVLGVDVVVVLGHEHCGAVKAAVSANKGEPVPPEFHTLTDPIQPAVESAKAAVPGADTDHLIEASILENVKLQAGRLSAQSTIIGEALAAGKLQVATAVYELASGRASLI